MSYSEREFGKALPLNISDTNTSKTPPQTPPISSYEVILLFTAMETFSKSDEKF